MSFQSCNLGDHVGRFRVADTRHEDLLVRYKPGPLAAGMSTTVDIDVASRGFGEIHEDIKVVTETHIIHVPVHATVLENTPSSRVAQVEDELQFMDAEGAQSSSLPLKQSVRVVGPVSQFKKLQSRQRVAEASSSGDNYEEHRR
jgi:hypothetical protein